MGAYLSLYGMASLMITLLVGFSVCFDKLLEALCRIGIAWRGIGRGGPFVIVGRIAKVDGIALHFRHLDGIEDLACFVGERNLYLITAEPKIGVQVIVAAIFGIGFARAVYDHIAGCAGILTPSGKRHFMVLFGLLESP